MNKTEQNGIFDDAEVVSVYTSNQGVEDGILMENPRQDRFLQCNLMTTALYDRIKEIEEERNMKRVFPYNPNELIGCLMMGASQIFNEGKFDGDNDEHFFVMPETAEGLIVWFVANEYGRLTAMLPGDY